MNSATHNTGNGMKCGQIRCDLRSGGGTFHEYFDRVDGWQDAIRDWAKRLGKAGDKLFMYYAKNRVTFVFVKEMEI